MEKCILVGNGININYGGVDYTNGKIIERLTNNLTVDGKYKGVFNDSVSQSELAGVVFGLNDIMGYSGAYKLNRMKIYEKSNWAMDDMIGRLQNPSDNEAQKNTDNFRILPMKRKSIQRHLLQPV